MGSMISSSSNTREARLDNLKMTYLNMDREVNALLKLKGRTLQKINESTDITQKALLQQEAEELNARIVRLGQVSLQFKKIHGLLNEIHIQGEYAMNTNKLLASVHKDGEKYSIMREQVIGTIRTNGAPGVKAITEKVEQAREELHKILAENETDTERSTFAEITQMMTEMGLPSIGTVTEPVQLASAIVSSGSPPLPKTDS